MECNFHDNLKYRLWHLGKIAWESWETFTWLGFNKTFFSPSTNFLLYLRFFLYHQPNYFRKMCWHRRVLRLIQLTRALKCYCIHTDFQFFCGFFFWDPNLGNTVSFSWLLSSKNIVCFVICSTGMLASRDFLDQSSKQHLLDITYEPRCTNSGVVDLSFVLLAWIFHQRKSIS